MNAQTKDTGIDANWYFVIVQDPGSCHEQFVGYTDPKTNEKFLPAFRTKDQAQACFAIMPKDGLNGQFDAQAVIEDDLKKAAEESGHRVYLLDGKGTILEYIN